MEKEALRFPLLQISKRSMDDRLRGEAEVKLRKINEQIVKLEEEIDNANRAIVLELLDCIGSVYQTMKSNAKELDKGSAQVIVEACAEIENYVSELRILLKTYIISE